jgi:4-amino-4-deoxy-L-arabinose transferase-like glycosyltransferase
VIFGDMFPWSLLLPVAVWMLLSRQTVTAEPAAVAGDGPHSPRPPWLLMSWIATTVLFFSFSENKQDLYILPTVPASAALIGAAVDRFTHVNGQAGRGRLLSAAMGAVAVALALAGGAALYVFGWGEPAYRLAGAVPIGIVAVAGAAAAVWLLVRERRFGAVVALAAALTLVDWTFVLRTLPDFERYKPVRPFAELIEREAPLDATVGWYRVAVPSLVYYTRRHVREVLDPNVLAETFKSGKPVYVVIAADEYTLLKDQLPAPTFVRGRGPILDVKFGTILDRQPLPELLLVSNRSSTN